MLKILDPTAGPAKKGFVMARRYDNLYRLKLGVIWNGRTYGDLVLKGVTNKLKEKYNTETVDFLAKTYFNNVAPKEFFDKLVADKVDAVLVGVGD